MEQWLFLVGAVVTVYGVVLIGGLVRGAGWLTREADQTMIHVVVRVMLPALILDVVIGNPKLNDAASVAWPPVVGFVSVAVGLAAAWGVAKVMGRRIGLAQPHQRRTFALCVGVYNYGYVPLPLAERLFDQGTVGVLFVHNLGVEVAMWTIAMMTLEGRVGRGWHRRLINAPLLAIVAALLINAAGIERGWLPQFLMRMLHMLGVCAVPTALLLVGATIADHLAEARLTRGIGVIGSACVLRLGVLPAVGIVAAGWMSGAVELQRVMVLQAAMPAAAFPIILARHYGGDASIAVRVVLGTTLVSLITMPLWIDRGLAWLGI